MYVTLMYCSFVLIDIYGFLINDYIRINILGYLYIVIISKTLDFSFALVGQLVAATSCNNSY